MSSNVSDAKTELIVGPLSLGLSPPGIEQFIKMGQKARRIRFFDGAEEFGVELPQVEFKSLLKMAMTGMVQRIERLVDRFGHQRVSLMDLTRCFATAMVYRQFETKLWEVLQRSDVVIQWNRSNAKLVLNPNTNTQAQIFQLLVAKSKDTILTCKQTVLAVVQKKIVQDVRLLEEERKSLLLLSIRYLNTIDPVIWLVLANSRDDQATSQLEQDLQNLLAQYISRSELPEYLSYLMTELTLMLANIQPDSSPMPGGDRHEPVWVSFELGVLKKSQQERTKVKILIGNEGSDFEGLRGKIDQQSKISNSGQRNDGIEGLGNASELGLYYMTCLKDACRTMDVGFESFVNVVPHSKRTLINLVLTV